MVAGVERRENRNSCRFMKRLRICNLMKKERKIDIKSIEETSPANVASLALE